MNKPRFVISCPFDTYSGYGARSRDIVKAIIELDKYNVQLLPQRWGATAWGFCKDHPEWEFLLNYKVSQDWNKTQPDIWMQITIPNEIQAVGKYNIGCTAGIESTACKPEWVEGLNRMDMNWGSSKHTKEVFKSMAFEKKDKNTNQLIGKVTLVKPMHVVFEGADLDVYKPIKSKNTIDLSNIKENFNYLFVGHWMQGEIGHDRKNVGFLIKAFFEIFKNKKTKPGLILKTSIGVDSYMGRDTILKKIKDIRKSVNSTDLPNIYLISGEFNNSEMNELYNHSKIKSMVSLTKGEGFGRPLLEASLSGKPVIATAWSGHIDFLAPNSTLLPRNLAKIHPNAVWGEIILADSEWFNVNYNYASKILKDVYKNYKPYVLTGKKQMSHSKNNFSLEKMNIDFATMINKYIIKKEEVQLSLPPLPKLQKV